MVVFELRTHKTYGRGVIETVITQDKSKRQRNKYAEGEGRDMYDTRGGRPGGGT